MILVNTPGSREETYPQLLHASWNGWTFADTIFPTFLWIVGVALTLSTAARAERGEDRASLLKHAIRRGLMLFCCGVFLDLFSFPNRHFPFFYFGDRLQFTGVLQKIAVCYLVAFVIFLWTSWRGVVLGIVGLNLIYLGVMFLYPVPGCGAGALTMDCNFARYLDGMLLKGHMWGNANAQDPDGLGSVLPATSTILFGVLVGYLLRIESTSRQLISRLLAMGCALAGAGILLANWVIPVNKPLWTTSYAVLMAGIAAVAFAFWYWVVDVKKWSRWLTPLEIFGMNAVAAYMISRLGINIPKVHYFGKTLYDDVCRQIANGANASLLYAILFVIGVYVAVYLMYRQRWFLRF